MRAYFRDITSHCTFVEDVITSALTLLCQDLKATVSSMAAATPPVRSSCRNCMLLMGLDLLLCFQGIEPTKYSDLPNTVSPVSGLFCPKPVLVVVLMNLLWGFSVSTSALTMMLTCTPSKNKNYQSHSWSKDYNRVPPYAAQQHLTI